MKNWNKIVMIICVLATAGLLIAEEPSDKKKSGDTVDTKNPPTTQPAGAKLPDVKLPAKLPAVVATVGGKEIFGEKIDGFVASEFAKMNEQIKTRMPMIPAEKRMDVILSAQQWINSLPQTILNKMIFQNLLKDFVKSQNIQATDADLAKIKEKFAANAAELKISVEEMMKTAEITDEDLMDEACFERLRGETLAPEKIAAFIKDNPSCFNGTKVQASHILIKCDPVAPTTEQKAAMAKLEEIAGEILSSKIKFEDAAKQYSSDPGSKDKGGDLGEFSFQQMVPPFAMAAFHTKVGKLSGIIRSQYGFHLIKVTKRIEGEEKVDPKLPDNEKIATAVLMSEMQNNIFDHALTNSPIVINK